MKICILSMQRVNNYGSILQAYALKQLLQNLNNDVFFIDIENIQEEKHLLDSALYNFNNEIEYKENSKIDRFLKLDDSWIGRIRKVISKLKQIRQYEAFRKEYLNLDNVETAQPYDCCVIGSDEVFNCLMPSPWGFTSQLFGNVKQTKKVITYAASCGATRIDDIPDKGKELIAKALGNISSFSVRDCNTFQFLNAFVSMPISLNLDPALVYDFHEEIRTIDITKKVPSHYCLVYSYNNRINDKALVEEIIKFCERKNMEIISLCGVQRWIKNHKSLSPFEVLKAFQLADYVITDTFHGTIFATKYSRRFGIITKDSNNNKLNDLVHRIGIEDHVIYDSQKIEDVLSLVKSKEIEKLIVYERERTMTYLSDSL